MRKKRGADNKMVFKTINQAIELYNKYRSPEATARLEKIENDRVVVRFTGSFCHTCGIRDWVEDLVYVLEDLGVEAELVEYIEPESDEKYRVGVFKVKNIVKPVKRGEVKEDVYR